ncbi:Hsp20/alpha crystallin family protein [Sediminibacterium soli]|uniref:Hsp20/alpha crystallin family protein n=1 Tax=Sediminibacterium soli TaxID=2698829 RepID=UPI001379BF30|nr:Hsp20/alpha crystallin family protein [Sediminibacterium soli]NCI46381.1 Hsp20/alpha crystallin family protein [Sediminibacterium soli]
MTLVKHNPSNLGVLFDEFFQGFPGTWGRDIQNGFSPAVNVHETRDAYHVELNAPGRNKEDFKISLDKGLLTVSYEKQAESENKDYKTIRKEFSYSGFKRSFTIDDKINVAGIQAKYENGVLKVFLPKKETVTVEPQQIAIS